MGQSIKQYIGLNSFYKKPDGSEMTHKEIYTKLVNDIGLNNIIPYIPATKSEIEQSLQTDPYLNTIPIEKWTNQHDAFIQRGLFRSLGITHSSLSETVSLLKEAARIWVEQDTPQQK